MAGSRLADRTFCRLLAFQLGLDALPAAKPRCQLLLFSHDDRTEIYRGFEWRWLAKKLISLGYRHR